MRRWWRYEEPDGYTARVTLTCMLCARPRFSPLLPVLRGDYRYRTMSLRGLIDHYRDSHTLNFVSVMSVHAQTQIWRNEYLATQPGPKVWSTPFVRTHRSNFYFRGLTS